jgi:hypothetical protein
MQTARIDSCSRIAIAPRPGRRFKRADPGNIGLSLYFQYKWDYKQALRLATVCHRGLFGSAGSDGTISDSARSGPCRRILAHQRFSARKIKSPATLAGSNAADIARKRRQQARDRSVHAAGWSFRLFARVLVDFTHSLRGRAMLEWQRRWKHSTGLSGTRLRVFIKWRTMRPAWQPMPELSREFAILDRTEWRGPVRSNTVSRQSIP